MIAAILRAQFLSMRIGASRGATLGIVTGAIWYGMWCFVAGALYLVSGRADAAQLDRGLPLVLAGVCAYWQLIPVISASMGSGLDLRKLLVYPAPHEKLFLVEVLLRLTTGAEMVLVLVAGTLGLLRNPLAGGWAAAPGLVPAILIFILFNLLLASGVRSLLERLLTNRKIRELLGILLLSVYVVPRLLTYTGVRPGASNGLFRAVSAAVFPWAAAAHAGLPLAPGESRWLGLLSLGVWTLLAWWFGRAQFERNLRYDAIAAQATPLRDTASRAQVWKDRFYRLPSLIWPDPVAAMVEKELRSLARAPRFRMVFIMGFTFGLAVWFPAMAGRHDRHATLPQYFLIVVCVYALTLLGQVSYWNCFGFDRSAAAIYFIAPQPLRKTLIGKNIASMVFVYLEVLVLIGISLALRLTSGWSNAVETLLVVGICSLYLLGIGNLSSVHYPRGLSPERVSQGGSAGRFQGLIFLLYPFTLLPVFLAYLARWALGSELAFALVMGIAATIGGVVYWIAMESAVHTANRRREQILRDLSGGEGPVAAD